MVLKDTTQYNTDFIYNKKVNKLRACSRLKIYVLMVSKIIRPIIFSVVKKISFPQARKFFLVKSIFPQSRNFYTNKIVFEQVFHSQGTCPQSSNFSLVKDTVKGFFVDHDSFPWLRNFSTVKEIFHSHGNFLQKRKFLAKILLDGGNFPQTRKISQAKRFHWSRNFYAVKKVLKKLKFLIHSILNLMQKYV